MGQAKIRGTFEERKAQSVVRRQAEEAQRAEERTQRALQRRQEASERQKAIGTEDRGPVLVGSGGSRHITAAMLAIALGAAAPMLVVGDKHSRGDSSR